MQACKIGSTYRRRSATVTVLALGALLPALLPAQDTSAVRREIRRAATDYERALRRSAPFRASGYTGNCDEIVGRFCLTHDHGSGDVLPPEPEPVKRARSRAIEAFEAAFALWPSDTLVAGPLVRFLIEHEQPAKAVDIAARFARLNQTPPWPHMLQGLALHAHGDYRAAEASFDSVLAQLKPSEREHWRDLRVLLDDDEQPRYRALGDSLRDEYQQRLWRLSDPIYLTPGNESRSEHFARHVYGRILARAPYVTGAYSWAWDLEELTVRFGVPRARTQDFARGMSFENPITEHYDSGQQTYVPPTFIVKPAIGELQPVPAWPYDTIRSRNGYAPRSVRNMRPLEHVLSRFREGDSITARVDAQLPFDSAVKRPARVEVGLFLLDSTFRVIASRVDTATVSGDTAVVQSTIALPDDAIAYSAEVRELGSRLTSRARYLLPEPLPVERPLLSDVLMLRVSDRLPASRSDGDFHPLPTLRFRRGQTAALYMEVTGLTPDNDRMVKYSVDLEVMEESRPGVFSRAVQRLGRALGVAGDEISPRITWNEQKPTAVAIPIVLNLGRLQLDTGLKRFRVTVTDRETGVRSSIDRIVRIER